MCKFYRLFTCSYLESEKKVMRTKMIIGWICFFLPALCGCGNYLQDEGEDAAYAKAVEVLRAVADAYAQDEQFAMYGGDQEHAVMDEPGTFDVNKMQEMEQVLGLPAEYASKITDAASMVHMMNGNVFTGAAYRLKSDVNQEDFAQAVKTSLTEKQWMCGQPDTMMVMDVDGTYVITAYGEAEIMDTFKTKASKVFQKAKILTEAPIV